MRFLSSLAIHLASDELRIETDGHILAYQDAASFQGRVPGEAEILAIDFGGGGEANACIAPWIFGGGAGAFDCKGHGPGNSAHGQVAGYSILAFRFLLDRG